jgi:aminopeptidase YwaD
MMYRSFLIVFIFFSINTPAQDSVYARHIIDTLTSPAFNGRGYIKEGLSKAEDFLKDELVSLGLSPIDGKHFIQEFSYNVNTFPSEMSVTVNDKPLCPGFDFIVSPESRSVKGKFDLEQVDSTHFINAKSKIIVSLENKLTWSVSEQVANYTTIKILKSVLNEPPSTIEVFITNKLVKKFRTANICGRVKGTLHPDSFIVFTAHYDHLGGMGDAVYFPGANDNASGVSLLLTLAKYYSKHPQSYSIAFILFSGEEAGLLGSEYFTKHPLIPLSEIKFLTNLDLTGTGVEGITVVNATEFSKEFSLLKSINEKEHLLAAINSRGKAKNSDHYWFTEKNVHSIFIYTLGGIKAYHDVNDLSATLPDDHHLALFRLLREFTTQLINSN